MAKVKKIDSDVTGLRIAEEESIGVLPTTPVWFGYEPNSYSDFGGEFTKIARNPINPSRQIKKGATVDLSASFGFVSDVTQKNIESIMQGFVFADLRQKESESVVGISGTSIYEVVDESGFAVGDLIYASGNPDSANNGLKNVSAVSAGDITVSQTLIDNASVITDSKISKVGMQSPAGDIDVDISGSLPQITSTVFDFTTLGLIPGEWIYIGGDSAATRFSNDENNGFCRVRSVDVNSITMDKTESAMVAEDTTTETIQIFIGKVLKNELGTLIKRRTYQAERTLGAPDDALPSEIQAEYIVGSVPSELTFNMSSADKVTLDMSFVGIDVDFIEGPEPLKTGTRPSIEEAEAFNTSSDFSRIKLARVVDGNPAPEDLFAFAEELSITLSNNLEPNKALGVLGSFDVSAGNFQIGGSMTAYFADIAATKAIKDNDDLTIDVHMVKSNAGISMDLPLISLGDGRPNVEQNQSIRLPLTMEAATGAKISTDLDYTLLFMFWDYLPDAAE